MKYLSLLASLMLVSIVVFGVGGIWFMTHIPTPELLQLNQKVAEKEAETELYKAKAEYNQSVVDGRRDLQRLETQEAIEAGILYRISLAIAYSFKNLWLLWVFATMAILVYSQRTRFMQQVEFAFDGIATTIPANKAVELTQEAIKAKELESSSKILALQEDTTHRRLQDGLATVRTLKSFVPAGHPEPADVVDVEALPAFTGPVYLSQLLLDDNYEPGLIPYGRNLETGGLVQVDFDTRKTCLKLGEMGTGKTTGAKAEIYAGFTLKYEQQKPIRMFLIDAHYGFKESLATDLKPCLSLFDGAILGKDCLTGSVLDFLQQMIAEAEEFQASDIDDPETIDLIWFDEYNETIEEADDPKAIEKAVKRLINLRKAGKYLSLNVYDSSKGNHSNKGLQPAKMACSVVVYRTNENQAGQVLGWQHKDILRQVPTLAQGQAVLYLPDADHELAIVQTCLVSGSDFFRFEKFMSDRSKPSDMNSDTRSELETQLGDDVTAADIKTLMSDQGFSLSKLSKAAGVPKSTLSNFFNGKGNLSNEQFTAILNFLEPAKTENVLTFEQVQARHRERLQKQA